MNTFTLPEHISAKVNEFGLALGISADLALQALVESAFVSYEALTRVATTIKQPVIAVDEPIVPSYKYLIKVNDEELGGNTVSELFIAFVGKYTPKSIFIALLNNNKERNTNAIVQMSKPTNRHVEYTDGDNKLWYVYTNFSTEAALKKLHEVAGFMDLNFEIISQ